MNQKPPLTFEENRPPLPETLEFIRSLAVAAAPTHCRLIVTGTGPYTDLAFQLFGQSPEAVTILNQLLMKLKVHFPDLILTDEGRAESAHLFSFQDHQGLKARLSYFQTLESPFDTVKIIIQKDGSESPPGVYDTFIAQQDGVIFEATQGSSS